MYWLAISEQSRPASYGYCARLAVSAINVTASRWGYLWSPQCDVIWTLQDSHWWDKGIVPESVRAFTISSLANSNLDLYCQSHIGKVSEGKHLFQIRSMRLKGIKLYTASRSTLQLQGGQSLLARGIHTFLHPDLLGRTTICRSGPPISDMDLRHTSRLTSQHSACNASTQLSRAVTITCLSDTWHFPHFRADHKVIWSAAELLIKV